MKAAVFDYLRAASVDEACELLGRDGDDAKVIAGGQSLVPMMAMRLTRPSRLVDINEIAALRIVTVGADAVTTGACARQCVVARDDALHARVPLLRRALAWVGHTQTRNRGTLGGSLAHADPAAELPLVAQVLGARIKARSTRGERVIHAADFFDGPLTTTLAPHECVVEIEWPAWPERRTGSAFTEVSRRHGDFAIVAACAQVAVDETGRCTRVAFGLAGGATKPMAFPALAKRLVGGGMDDAALKDVARKAAAELDPAGDLHASAAYRKHLAAVLATRVLRDAYAEALSKR